jgi:hypothetical protein
MLPMQKRKVMEHLNRIFGKNLSPEREEFKMKVYRGIVGEYTQEDIEAAEREFQEVKNQYMTEMIYDDCSPAGECQVIKGKIMSQEIIEQDGIDVTITDSRPEPNTIDT